MAIRPQTGMPHRLGFSVPAEWNSHRAVWLAYPHNPDHFEDLEAAQASMLKFAVTLEPSELVHMLVPNHEVLAEAMQQLIEAGANPKRVQLQIAPYKDIWLRDTGPVFALRSDGREIAAIDWQFDGWGGQFQDVVEDDALASWIAERVTDMIFRAPMVMEGGAIEVNGAGTLLTTEPVLLAGRNPRFSRSMTESYLRQYTGVQQVLWLPGKMSSDDTGGHVDNLARFVNAHTIVACRTQNKDHPDYEAFEYNFALLQAATDMRGRPFEVLELPVPDPVEIDGKIAAASYANFYIGNTVVVVPTYDRPQDREAVDVLRKLFPYRHVVGLDGTALLSGGGSFHCVSQQQPGQ